MDLYLIEDSQSRLSKVDSKNYLGKIQDDEFQLLKELSIIEDRYDYYKDLRWSRDQVKDKYERLSKLVLSDRRLASNTSNFSEYLVLAWKEQMGIIGYSD